MAFMTCPTIVWHLLIAVICSAGVGQAARQAGDDRPNFIIYVPDGKIIKSSCSNILPFIWYSCGPAILFDLVAIRRPDRFPLSKIVVGSSPVVYL